MRKIFISLVFCISLLSSSEYGSVMGFEFGSPMSEFEKVGFECQKEKVGYYCEYHQYPNYHTKDKERIKKRKKLIKDKRIHTVALEFDDDMKLFSLIFITKKYLLFEYAIYRNEAQEILNFFNKLPFPKEKIFDSNEAYQKGSGGFYKFYRWIANKKMNDEHNKKLKEVQVREKNAEQAKINSLKANF